MRRNGFRALCYLAFFACAVASALAVRDMRLAIDGAVAPVQRTASEFQRLSEWFPGLEWAAYAQTPDCALKAEAFPARTAQVAVVRYAGDLRAAAFLPRKSGYFPDESALDGCALDAGTAYALFKSEDILGERVIFEEKAYRVTGVLDGAARLMFIPADGARQLDKLAVRGGDFAALQSAAAALEEELTPWILTDGERASWARLLCALPLVLAAALGLGALRRWGSAGCAACKTLRWALAALVVFWAVSTVPIRFLPGRWSDFAFYGEQWSGWQSRTVRLPDFRDRMLWVDQARALLLAVLSCAALTLERMRRI